MTPEDRVYVVVVEGAVVSMQALAPGAEGYDAARSDIIRRERDAIELHRGRIERGASMDGAYSFLVLETARAFALLQLQSVAQAIEDNLDRIQAFRG